VLGFDEGFQAGEIAGPEGAILRDPGIDGAEGFGIELVDTVASGAVLANQMRAAEQAQMFGDGRAGDGKSAGDLSGGLAAAAQQIEHRAASGIGESLEGGLGRICNRTVTHNA